MPAVRRRFADDTTSKLQNMNPSSKEDWEQFSDLLFTELLKKQSSKPGFEKHFVPHFVKNIASTLRDVDIRKTSALLKTYAEEKARLEKEAKKTGGQKKVSRPKTVGTASAKNVYVPMTNPQTPTPRPLVAVLST